MPTPLIDARAYASIKTAITANGWDTLDPALIVLLGKLDPATTNEADIVLWDDLRARVERFTNATVRGGTIIVPAHRLPAGFTVGKQAGTTDAVAISAAGNNLILGPSGSGKTTLVQWELLSAYQRGVQLIIPDAKGDSTFWTVLHAGMFTINETSEWNPIAMPPWRRTIAEHVNEQVERWRPSFFSGETQGAIFRRALTNALSEHHDASCEDTHRHVEKLRSLYKYYAWQEGVTGVSERFHKINARLPIAYKTRRGRPLADVLQAHLYIPMLTFDPVMEWVILQLLGHIFQRNKHAGIRHITTLAALDEGLTTTSATRASTNITGQNPFALLATMSREPGLRLAFTSASITHLDPLVLQNCATISILPGIMDDRDLKLLGLNQQTATYAKNLPKGSAVFLYPGQLAWPITVTFDPLPTGLKELRPTPPAPAAPQPEPIVTFRPLLGTAPAGIHLSPLQEAFLRGVCTLPLDTVSGHYQRHGLRPQAGDRVKNHLLKLGFINATPVIVTDGRGGRAIILTGTATAFAHFGIAPPKGSSRGGGVSHNYFVQQVLRYVDGASAETNMTLPDGRQHCVDITVTYQEVKHQTLASALREHATTLARDTPSINDGEVISLEIECSDPVKTGNANAVRCLGAGLPLTIFATLPKDQQGLRLTLQKTVPAEDWHRVATMSVLKLLDTLRGKGTKL